MKTKTNERSIASNDCFFLSFSFVWHLFCFVSFPILDVSLNRQKARNESHRRKSPTCSKSDGVDQMQKRVL